MKHAAFDVAVLRLGHRPHRDMRVTTHVALVARAFGADAAIIADVRDPVLEDTIRKVNERWGGTFALTTGVPWREVIVKWKQHGAEIIHLTMYGVNVEEQIDSIRSSPKHKLVVVGATKVPREVYSLADYNIAITRQPHSEVSALSIFLDRLFQGKESTHTLSDAMTSLKLAPKRHESTAQKSANSLTVQTAVETWMKNY